MAAPARFKFDPEAPIINLKTPWYKQKLMLQSRLKRIVLNWGRRSGKSAGAGLKAAISAITDQGTYYIIAPTIGNADKIYWDPILKTIFKNSFLVDPLYAKDVQGLKDWKEVGFNENEKSVTLNYIENAKITLPTGETITVNHDKTQPRSKIVLYGATEPDNILGIGLKGVILDECAKMLNFDYVWRKVVRPMLGDYKGWAVFISTPLGIHNHWFSFVNLAKSDPKKYYYDHATAYENPHFPDDEIEEAREEAVATNQLNVFEQEWLAEFVNPEGAIFPEFDPEVHTFLASEMPRNGVKFLGVDFGFSPDPAAIISLMMDDLGNWWIYDETYDTNLDEDRVANVIKNLRMDNVFARIIGDAQRKDTIELLRRVYRIPMQPGPKGAGSILTGIGIIHSLLRVQTNGQPRLRIQANLLNTIREFQSYSRKRDAQGNYFDIPEDANNHTIDAIRYVLARVLRKDDTEEKQEDVPVKKKYSPTGRSLN